MSTLAQFAMRAEEQSHEGVADSDATERMTLEVTIQDVQALFNELGE